MRIDVLTLFPDMFTGVLGASILGRAASDLAPRSHQNTPFRGREAVVSYHVHNFRDWSADARHHKVDASPYGGGPGMVMQCQPVWDAVQAVEALDPAAPLRILMTPQGQPLTQKLCETLAKAPRLLILAGHYEGLDQRVIDHLHDEPPGSLRVGAGGLAPDFTATSDGYLLELSVGDYVLSGGELPAMTLIDALVRLLPGALGHAESAHHDSFSPGVARLLDHPHYTKPPEWSGREVPEVLRSGDHARIDAWRCERSREATRARRPDLLGMPAAGAKPALVTLRDANPADTDALLALHRLAFPSDAEAKLVQRLLAGDEAILSILAEATPAPAPAPGSNSSGGGSKGTSGGGGGGQVVGHALVTALIHADQPSLRGLLALAPLAVDPLWQRQGLGSALVREAIRQAKDARAARLFVLGDPVFYQRFGFEPASRQGFTSPYAEAGDAFQVLTLRDTKPVPGGALHYAEAFG